MTRRANFGPAFVPSGGCAKSAIDILRPLISCHDVISIDSEQMHAGLNEG